MHNNVIIVIGKLKIVIDKENAYEILYKIIYFKQ